MFVQTGTKLHKLPELVKTQVEAIKNLKIDKITVWDSMSAGKDGKSPTSANFLSGMLGSIPPFEELFKMAGMELPDYLKGTKKEAKPNVAPVVEDAQEVKSSGDEEAKDIKPEQNRKDQKK